MIIPNFLVYNESGIYCKTGDFYLDPKLPVNHAVISHAHGDHAVRGNQAVYCTRSTAAIMEHRFKKNAGKTFHIYQFSSSFELHGVKITFIPAGHILGSAQVLMEYNNVRYLYSGDYKLQSDDTCEPLEFLEADVLITETTFANPEVQHPDPVLEILKLNTNQHNILLGSYSLGKAQRIISLISVHCPDRKILVHHSIIPLNKIYENFGFFKGSCEPYNRKLMKQPEMGYVYIVPPLTFNSYFRAKNVLKVFASGWKGRQSQNDMELLISDHVDWNDIIEMISKVKPKQIWTVHGDGSHLKKHFDTQLLINPLSKC